MIRVGNIIGCFARPVEVIIEYDHSYVRGEEVVGFSDFFMFNVSIQELEGKDLRFLPEGARVQEHRKLYSKERLPVNGFDNNNGINSVLFRIDSEVYRLVGYPRWDGDYSIFIVEQLQSGDSLPLFRITEDGDNRITEDSETRVTE
jgi:hypothetical protein